MIQEKGENKKGKTVKLEFSELTLWKLGTIAFGILFIVSLVTGGFGSGGGKAIASPSVPSQIQQQPQGKINVERGNAYFKGDEDAPVTIIEYSDFQCPFCLRFFEQTLPEIERQYVDTGKAMLVYKHLPLSSIHPYAEKAAEAAECAGVQGKFWEMHDKIFQNQAALAVDNLKGYAASLGVNAKKFNACLDNGDMAKKVQDDLAEATRIGASGTPTFLINGQKVVGAQPFGAFQAVIDAELAN